MCYDNLNQYVACIGRGTFQYEVLLPHTKIGYSRGVSKSWVFWPIAQDVCEQNETATIEPLHTSSTNRPRSWSTRNHGGLILPLNFLLATQKTKWFIWELSHVISVVEPSCHPVTLGTHQARSARLLLDCPHEEMHGWNFSPVVSPIVEPLPHPLGNHVRARSLAGLLLDCRTHKCYLWILSCISIVETLLFVDRRSENQEQSKEHFLVCLSNVYLSNMCTPSEQIPPPLIIII